MCRNFSAADWIAEFSGSIAFLNLHIVLFALWILLNTGWTERFKDTWFGRITNFDAFPFGLLTMIVSLEAIFLSTFVMIGQNRQAAFQQAKADHDFQAQELELKTNTELTREIHRLTAELHSRLMGPASAT